MSVDHGSVMKNHTVAAWKPTKKCRFRWREFTTVEETVEFVAELAIDGVCVWYRLLPTAKGTCPVCDHFMLSLICDCVEEKTK